MKKSGLEISEHVELAKHIRHARRRLIDAGSRYKANSKQYRALMRADKALLLLKSAMEDAMLEEQLWVENRSLLDVYFGRMPDDLPAGGLQVAK